jgi:hypothetical protein
MATCRCHTLNGSSFLPIVGPYPQFGLFGAPLFTCSMLRKIIREPARGLLVIEEPLWARRLGSSRLQTAGSSLQLVWEPRTGQIDVAGSLSAACHFLFDVSSSRLTSGGATCPCPLVSVSPTRRFRLRQWHSACTDPSSAQEGFAAASLPMTGVIA